MSENRNPKLDAVSVELGDPGWESLEDAFIWFDERQDGNWIVMTNQPRLSDWPTMSHLRIYGMPMNMPMIEVVRSGRGHGKGFEDYICCYLGVEADKTNPSRGQTPRVLRFFQEGKEVTVYLWGVILLARNVSTFLRVMRNEGYSVSSGRLPPLPQEPARWDKSFQNLDVGRPDDVIKLAKGFVLLGKTQSGAADIQAKVEVTRGGDWRSPEIKVMWADSGVLTAFAKKVDELRPIWTTIKGMADKCESKAEEAEWVSNMLSRPVVQGFIKQYPKLTDVLPLAVDSAIKPKNRAPRYLAFYHAASELGVSINDERLSIVDAYSKYQDKPLAPTSLKTYYERGKALLDPSD